LRVALRLLDRRGTMTAMVSHRMTDAPVPLEEHVPTADQFVMLRGTWATYEALLAARGERSCPRIAFLDGVVQLMSPSLDHECIKSAMGHLVAAYCMERRLSFTSGGSWTLRSKLKKAGLEPDDCFLFGDAPRRKRRPDLALEVIWTSGGIDKLEIYQRLRVREVWFWERDEIAVFTLGADDQYARAAASACLPGLDLALIARLATVVPHSDAILQLQAALRTSRVTE
jgi:Uma2 family endonuclease